MGPIILKAVALAERLLSGSRPGSPLRGPHSRADRGASQDSGDRRCCGRRLVHARLQKPPPPPLPPHILPARPGPCSVRPATNGRRVLASQQPIAGGAATPHTPLSWKATRHPRPAAPTPPPASA
ncbi:PREDICTED: zinc finger homeobox protein 4-like [Cercocebus atys]|uniref:zinc finger homeobox protein 4-like n=1 Tax=Cercocebus atys TaxID=9531 RepID=UPI0005F4E31A|nr:PREDICTED: zinc finger homeobox protein 4-like [Cercocebus atys]